MVHGPRSTVRGSKRRPELQLRRGASGVTSLLDAAKHPQRPVIDDMRALIAGAVPAAVESIKWNAPSFATAEHFATFHLRGKVGVQLVLHLGAKPKTAQDMRRIVADDRGLLEWKGPDRAIVTVRDAAHLATIRTDLTRLITSWAAHVT